MIQLASGQTFSGKAGTATAVTYTINKDLITTGDDFTPVQGQLASSTATLFTSTGGQTLIRSIQITNTTASPVTGVVFYLGGTAAANQLVTLSLAANGSATYESGQGWLTYDASGNVLGGSAYVDTTTNQTVGGVKTFSSPPVLSTGEKFTGLAGSGVAYNQGLLFYDTDSESLTFMNNDSTPTLQVGQEEWVRVKNVTGSTIANGAAVYISGADAGSGLPTIALAKGDAATTIIGAGLATESIVNNAIGYVTTMGVVHGLDTSGFSAGATIFISATTAGALTATAPLSPNYRYRLGIVVVSSATVGSIHVTPSTAALGNGTANQVFGMNNAGTAQEVKTIQGTASDVVVAQGTNTITISTTGKAVSSRLINTTAPLTGGGDLSADRTLAISASSTSAAGSESAAHYNTTQNQWYDVTNYGVSISNSGATNVSAMNTLIQTTAPGPSKFYFPDTGANYPMTGTITVTHNGQTFMGAGMRSSVLFVGNTTQDLFSLNDSVTNITFQDLGFWSTATATAGSVINCGTVSGTGNQQVNMYRCGMEGFGGNFFNGFLFNGTRGGEVSNIEDCVLNAFRGWGIGVVGNTTVPNTTSALTMTNVLMNGSITGTTGAIAGVYQQQCGALQINSCDIIQCTNNLLTSPLTSTSQVVASIYATNSYFDASHGSCVKLGGTQPTVRCKFVSCSMTVSADATTNYSAIEFSNTATNPPGDIDILNCNIQNTFNNTGTTNGILLTAASNVKIMGNNINGWTNNIQASAAASSATKLNIMGNSLGPGTVSASASTNDILLNAGTYGYIQIVENIFAPTSPFQTTSTTHINDGSTTANPGLKNIFNNIGMANSGNVPTLTTASQSFPASATTLATGTSISLPTNGLQIGNKFRFDCTMLKTTVAGTVAMVAAVKFGTANTTADAAINSFTAGTSTAIVDTAQFSIVVEILTLGASATCKAMCMYIHSPGAAATGLSVLPVAGTAAAFNSTLASPFLHLDITHGASIVATGTAIGYQIQ